jgi:prophage regulatory protein
MASEPTDDNRSPATFTERPAEGVGQPPRLLRFPAVRHRTGLSRSTIWRLERQGSFPRHRRISRNAVAWLEGDVTAWIRSKAGPDHPGEAGPYDVSRPAARRRRRRP